MFLRLFKVIESELLAFKRSTAVSIVFYCITRRRKHLERRNCKKFRTRTTKSQNLSMNGFFRISFFFHNKTMKNIWNIKILMCLKMFCLSIKNCEYRSNFWNFFNILTNVDDDRYEIIIHFTLHKIHRLVHVICAAYAQFSFRIQRPKSEWIHNINRHQDI